MDSKLSRKLRDWIATEIQKRNDQMANGLEYQQYQKAVAAVQTLRDVDKELDAIEKELRDAF